MLSSTSTVDSYQWPRNFLSLLKRNMHGTYVSVEPFHLFRYLDEQTFRYSYRKGMNDQTRFEKMMGNVAGRG